VRIHEIARPRVVSTAPESSWAVPMPGPQPRSLLRDTHPTLFDEAVWVVGADIALATLGTKRSRQVTWHCGTCGNEWDATPAARSRGGGCPDRARVKRGPLPCAQAPLGMSLMDLHRSVSPARAPHHEHPRLRCGDARRD
jgi:hypothetical protein